MNEERKTLAASLIEYIENLSLVTDQLIPSFKEVVKPSEETIKTFNKVMEGITLVFEALITQVLMEKTEIDEASNKLQEVMYNMVETLENGDFMTLGDMLQYELLPLFKMWGEGINSYKEKVDEL